MNTVFLYGLCVLFADVRRAAQPRLARNPADRIHRFLSADVHFMTVNVPRKGHDNDLTSNYHPHLIRYYIEHVWKLKRPDIIISVTGQMVWRVKI